jgi:hypothetical protein
MPAAGSDRSAGAMRLILAGLRKIQQQNGLFFETLAGNFC